MYNRAAAGAPSGLGSSFGSVEPLWGYPGEREGLASRRVWIAEPTQMRPARAALGWNVPAIPMTGELADWLGLTVSELHWFADLKGLGCKRNVPRLRHYHYRVLAKESGDPRLIETPKKRLKQLQRKILREILEKTPVHDWAHGFRKGRSSRTFVAPHVGQRVVVRLDLQDFFPSLSAGRIQTFFRKARSGGRCRLARRNLCERGAAGRVERGWAGGGPAAFATSP